VTLKRKKSINMDGNMTDGSEKSDDREYQLMLEQERLLLEATELLEELMVEGHVSRKELADRLGKSKAHVTQILSGSRNLTLRTLAEVAYQLGARVHLDAQKSEQSPAAWYAKGLTVGSMAGSTAPAEHFDDCAFREAASDRFYKVLLLQRPEGFGAVHAARNRQRSCGHGKGWSIYPIVDGPTGAVSDTRDEADRVGYCCT